MNDKLNRCPKCNGIPGGSQFRDELNEPFKFRVLCMFCDTIGPARTSMDDAVEEWNKFESMVDWP